MRTRFRLLTTLVLVLMVGTCVWGSTIADKLVTLDGIKTDIREAIEAQGVIVPNPGDFGTYAGLIANIEGGGGEVADYERPADWLELPEVLETDQKMVALFAVHEAQKNIVAFTVSGDYTVDWGDGTTVDYSAGSVASHNYVYENLGAETWSDRGYRQAILTITPQDGQDITSFELSGYPCSSPQPIRPTYTFLDVVLSFPNCDEFSFGYGLVGIMGIDSVLKMLESFEMRSSFLSVSSYNNLFRNAFTLRRAVVKANEAVTDMGNMFRNCYSLVSVSLSGTSSVTDMRYMFTYCHSLVSVPLFDTSEVTNMSYMFGYCYSLASVPLFDTSEVTHMSNMFEGCHSLVSVPLFDTSEVTTMESMFRNCHSLVSVSLFDTSEVTTMESMFRDCYSLVSVSLSGTSSVTTMQSMFNGCYSLVSVSLSGTSSVTSMRSMFSDCYSLTSVPLFDTSEVTSMRSMFRDCYSLTSVPPFDTSEVTSMQDMFSGCYSLTSVPPFDMSNVTNVISMFAFCRSIKRVQAPLRISASLNNASMEYDALVETITSLVPGDYTLTIANNPGAAAVMEDIANDIITVPTGWTISN